MLQDTFFTFTPPFNDGNNLKTGITLNAAHAIFKGHFPGKPVVPGVCMMQMVKEVLEAHLGKKTRLVKADNVKFLSFMDPDQHIHSRLELKITPDAKRFKVDAQLLNDETVFLKFKGVFV